MLTSSTLSVKLIFMVNAYHRGDLDESLLTAARAELAEKGVRGFSLRSVAARVGVSRAAPYRHFSGKEGLLAALVGLGFRELTDVLKTADAAAAGGDFAKLKAQGLAYLAFGRDEPELLNLMFSRVGQDAVSEVLAAGSGSATAFGDIDAFAVLANRVAACQNAGSLVRGPDPFVLAALVWTAIHGIAVLQRERVLDGMARDHGIANSEDALLEAFGAVFMRDGDA